MATVYDVFIACANAVKRSELIKRENVRDKEFHFQDWFEGRLNELNVDYDAPARNTYPDYRLVHQAEGYELKGLAYPGRYINYDANSQVPTGLHHGRCIYYVFGRYPKTDESEYALHDLVICDGDFLNADHDYVHENKHVKGFGTYGDIMIRDRKMYVAPTPFGLASGLERQMTLILPSRHEPGDRFEVVGNLTRTEADELVVGYEFDLTTNEINIQRIPNPNAGTEHTFVAYRCRGDEGPAVAMRPLGDEMRAG